MKFAKTMLTSGLLLAATASTPSFAADTVSLGTPSYGGSGCPAGSASTTVSPDGQELSILFDKFVANKGRKSCALTIPVRVPQGLQVSIYTVDYRGYVAPRTMGKLTTDYFFAGQATRPVTRVFNGEVNYSERDNVTTMVNVWSRCGDSVNMRVNAAMAASGAGDATVDSVDVAHAGLIYHLKYRACR